MHYAGKASPQGFGIAVASAIALLALTACGLHISIGSIGSAGPSRSESKIARAIDPRLVDVVSVLRYQNARAAGTGIVLTSRGEVLTNNHVIRGATSIRVIDVGSGRSYRATVVGYDEKDDIAVLRLHGASGLKAVRIGRAPRARLGERVIAIGNAGGAGGTPSVAAGRITGLHVSIIANDQAAGTSEHLNGLIRTDAGIQAGDSGGPLVSASGQVVGVDTAASSLFSFQAGTAQGFAIPIGRALGIARQIEAGRGSATVHIGPTGFLGVHLEKARVPGSQGQTGAGVVSVIGGFPAAQAGLRPGDVIVSVAGSPVTSPSSIAAALVPHHPGDHIALRWVDRAGQSHTATVVLTPGPAA
jgi:S1-C subfamily serine protease